MSTLLATPEATAEEATVTKAFIRAGEILGLSRKQLAKIIGSSESQVSRMGSGVKYLRVSNTHQWGASLLLIRIYRGLIATLGNQSSAKAWLHGYNSVLNGIPVDLIESYEGLIDVARYVDFQRGQF